MKSQALQELVKEIFGDEGIKTQFMANPDVILSKFALTEMEKRAVLTTHTKLGLMTSNSGQLQMKDDPYIWWD